MHYIFSIEGSIGSGKSTYIKHLMKTLDILNGNKVIYLLEPIDVWESIKDLENKNIIEKFYKNQFKYAFSFQMMAYISRINQLRECINKNPNSIIITERSVFTDKNVFAKMLYDDNKIEEIEYKIYLKWFDSFTKDLNICGIIYLDTNPDTCLNRIIKRNRLGENISLSYLHKCNKYHIDWIFKNNDIFNKTMVLDGNIVYYETPPKQWDKQFKEFINSYIKYNINDIDIDNIHGC